MNNVELLTFMYYIEQTQSTDKSVSEFYDLWSRIYEEFENLAEADEER